MEAELDEMRRHIGQLILPPAVRGPADAGTRDELLDSRETFEQLEEGAAGAEEEAEGAEGEAVCLDGGGLGGGGSA